MTEFLTQVQADFLATSITEIVAVVFGLLYVVLASRQNSWCWPAAFIGTGVSVYLFWDASLLMESGLNVYYLLMAIYGWWQWNYGSEQSDVLRVRRFKPIEHGVVFSLVALLAFASGFLLESHTNAARPFLDSATTWAAVITTWMVAKKILENWLYWIVINAVSIYLYLDRGLALYAALFLVYIVISIFGYRSWRRSLLRS